MKDFYRKSVRAIVHAAPILAILVSALYFFAIIVGSSSLIGVAWGVTVVFLGFLMIVIGLMAGAVVIRSLFAVAAEISLLVFLTQAFCSSPLRAPENNAAMTSLFTLGTLYIAYLFFSTLWERVTTIYKRSEDHPRTWERVVIIIAFFLFVGFFTWQLYLIVSPTVLGLCVYK